MFPTGSVPAMRRIAMCNYPVIHGGGYLVYATRVLAHK